MGSHEPRLRVRDLCTAFEAETRTRVVDHVSFDLHPGQVLALVGESGCGKTVTALSLLDLLPENGAVEKGQVFYRGRNLLEQTGREWRQIRGREIGMVFQDPTQALNPLWSIGFQVKEAITAHRSSSARDAKKTAIEWLGEVGIPAPDLRYDDYPHQMSGGLLQRVMLAIALCGHPSILIADEPTTALDVTVQAQILDLIATYLRTEGLSVLLISHDLGVVAELADEVAVMYAARIVEQAGAVDLFERRRHPYTEGLFRSLPPLDRRLDRLPVIPGQVPPSGSWEAGCRFADRCAFSDEICHQQDPPWIEMGSKRWGACHHPLGETS